MNAHLSDFRGAVPAPDRAHRILMVDDNLAIRELCAGALTGAGYQVDTVEDGAVGWQALQTDRYNLLVTDNSMPNLSGIELIRKLRAARMNLPVAPDGAHGWGGSVDADSPTGQTGEAR